MDQRTLQGEAEKLLQKMHLAPPREPGERLRSEDEARILELAASGVTQLDIARAVGCHQSTVSRTIADYADTRGLARRFLETKAIDVAQGLVAAAKDRPAEALKLLGKLDVVRDDEHKSAVGVQVIIGDRERPAIDASTITVRAVVEE
jgi:IS30 family transposase